MECVYSYGTSEHGVSKPICQKIFQSSPPKPFMGRLKLFKNAFKPTIAEDVTSFKNDPGWILGYGVVVERRTPNPEVLVSFPTDVTVLCP